jgi:hypothetical protein
MYFVEEKTGYIRGRGRYSIITVFNDLQSFGEKSVAGKLTMLGGDVTRMDITVDTLEPATDANESIFRVAGAKPVFTSADEDGRFTQPGAVYTAKPSLPGWPGKVTCDLNNDEHGHVRGVEVKDTMERCRHQADSRGSYELGVRARHNQRTPIARLRSRERGMTRCQSASD